MLRKSTFLIILILILFFGAKTSSAKIQPGISVSPSINHIDLSVDQPEYAITYSNNTKQAVTLKLSVEDFSEFENSYKLNFLEGIDAKNYKYSLSSWISFETKSIELSPGEKKQVRIFIDKQRITKGGHYASILAEVVSENKQDKVNIKQVLSSLLFVRAATGQETEQGKINDFKPLQDGIEYPDEFVLRFENSGNVQVIPYGLIQVYDPLGNLVAKGIFNENSLDALPESIRTYDIKTTTYQPVLIPGIYTAKASLHFGKNNIKTYHNITFFSLGSFDFTKILVILILIGALIFYYKKRVYKHKKQS